MLLIDRSMERMSRKDKRRLTVRGLAWSCILLCYWHWYFL